VRASSGTALSGLPFDRAQGIPSGALAVGHHRRREAGGIVPNHDGGAGHDAATCIDDDARIVDVVPRWPNAAPAEIWSIEVTRAANKPLMPTLSPKNTVVQMRLLAIDERASPLSNRCSRQKPTGAAMRRRRKRSRSNMLASTRSLLHYQCGLRCANNCIETD